MDRLSGLLHLDVRHRSAASCVRLRAQGAGALPCRSAAADLAHQRADVGRAFRPVDPGRPGHVPQCAGAGGRGRCLEPPVRGIARDRARCLRALFPGLPVRGLGRQAGARGARRRHVRDLSLIHI